VIVSGTLGDHGMAIMAQREPRLRVRNPFRHGGAARPRRVALAAAPGLRLLRDPTRGGLAATLNEIARSPASASCSTRRRSRRPQVAAACEFLGLDPLTSPTKAS
jgi:hydrogenase expression/formation protein HypE